MDGFVIAFAVVGIVVAIIAVLLFGAWAVSFYATISVRTFKYNLEEYCKVQKEHIEAKYAAKKERKAKLRAQKIEQQNKALESKMASNQRIFEIKLQSQELKQKQKEEDARTSADSWAKPEDK